MKHVILGAGPLGTTLDRLLAKEGQDACILDIMGNPAYDMPGTRPESMRF